jgi:hypothetical protein
MQCSCDISVDCCDYDYGCECHTWKIITARKHHRCGECFKANILPGQKYELAKWVQNGKWWQHRTCGDCLSLRDAFFKGGYIYEEVREYVSEYINDCGGDIPESCISELTPVARAFVCDEIESVWEQLE